MAKDLPPLHPGDVVRICHDNGWHRGVVSSRHETPRSYIMETEQGSTLKRNRQQLIQTAENTPVISPPVVDPPCSDDVPPTSVSHHPADSAASDSTTDSSVTDTGASTISHKGTDVVPKTSSKQSVKPQFDSITLLNRPVVRGGVRYVYLLVWHSLVLLL